MTAVASSNKNIQEGDIVFLSDEQTLKDMKDISEGGLNLTATRVRVFEKHWITWKIHEFSDSELVLLEKSVRDEVTELFVYFNANGFTPGTRQELVNSGSNWIFAEPADVNNFNPEELKFSELITSGEGEDFKKFLEVYEGVDGVDWVIVEWFCDNPKCENPYLLTLEIGNHIRTFQGAVVRDSEVTVYRKGSTHV